MRNRVERGFGSLAGICCILGQAQVLPAVENRKYTATPLPYDVVGRRRAADEADCQRMFPWHVGRAEPDCVWHNRHTGDAFCAIKGYSSSWHCCVRSFLFRDLLPRNVSHEEDSLDSHCYILSHRPYLVSSRCGTASRLASCGGMNPGEPEKSRERFASERISSLIEPLSCSAGSLMVRFPPGPPYPRRRP